MLSSKYTIVPTAIDSQCQIFVLILVKGKMEGINTSRRENNEMTTKLSYSTVKVGSAEPYLRDIRDKILSAAFPTHTSTKIIRIMLARLLNADGAWAMKVAQAV